MCATSGLSRTDSERAIALSLGDAGAADAGEPPTLVQVRVVAQRGGRCGHHALHNAMLAATAATEPDADVAAVFANDALRDVSFWKR